jgi:AcrR family transcriptional regulator
MTEPLTASAAPIWLPHTDWSPRGRLLEGMLLSVAEKGYSEATIADVVRHARMSKRTFYEHFDDKEACFVAAYAVAAAALLGRIALAVREAVGRAAQLDAAARTYFAGLEEHPALTRVLLSDIHAAGPAALAMRRRIHQQFAELLCAALLIPSLDGPPIVLSRELATAVVGGVNELVLLAIDEGRIDRLHELAGTAVALIQAAVAAEHMRAR